MSTTTKIDTGGPAFPSNPTPFSSDIPGMSLLDHFAGLAMQGLMRRWANDDPPIGEYAAEAYAIAQAMIAEKRRLEAL